MSPDFREAMSLVPYRFPLSTMECGEVDAEDLPEEERLILCRLPVSKPIRIIRGLLFASLNRPAGHSRAACVVLTNGEDIVRLGDFLYSGTCAFATDLA